MMRRKRAKRRTRTFAIAAALVCAASAALVSETLVITTSYPSPAGIYRRLITTQDAVFARDGGRVGIGVTRPEAKLDVGGTLKIGSLPADPPGAAEGTLYFNGVSGRFRGHQRGGWRDLGGAEILDTGCIGRAKGCHKGRVELGDFSLIELDGALVESDAYGWLKLWTGAGIVHSPLSGKIYRRGAEIVADLHVAGGPAVPWTYYYYHLLLPQLFGPLPFKDGYAKFAVGDGPGCLDRSSSPTFWWPVSWTTLVCVERSGPGVAITASNAKLQYTVYR